MAGYVNIQLTGVDPSSPIPSVNAEVRFAQGESSGDASPTKVLLIAQKTSGGAQTTNTVVGGPFANETDVITACGAGSYAHRMFLRFSKGCKNALIYILCPTASAGVAAVDVATITVTPTASGTASITICGVVCTYAYTTSDTVTTIAVGLKNAINAHTELPVSAGNVAGVLTITAKIVGTEGNTIRWSAKTSGGGVLVNAATSVPDVVLGGSGAGGAVTGTTACDYTAALATILGVKFDYIVPAAQDAVPLGLLSTQIATQALPSIGFRPFGIYGTALSSTNADTLAVGLNNPQMSGANSNAAAEEHYVLAAAFAAARVLNEVSDPSTNFDGYGTHSGDIFNFSAPVLQSNWPTPSTDFLLQLNNGVTPIGVTDGGVAYIVRSVTTRSLNGAVNDYRARDTSVPAIAYRFTKDLVAKLANAPFKKITQDPPNTTAPQPDQSFATPARVKMLVETLVRDYVNFGWLDPAKLQTCLNGIVVGVNSVNNSRMDVSVPLYSAILLHSKAALVNESSPSV